MAATRPWPLPCGYCQPTRDPAAALRPLPPSRPRRTAHIHAPRQACRACRHASSAWGRAQAAAGAAVHPNWGAVCTWKGRSPGGCGSCRWSPLLGCLLGLSSWALAWCAALASLLLLLLPLLVPLTHRQCGRLEGARMLQSQQRWKLWQRHPSEASSWVRVYL